MAISPQVVRGALVRLDGSSDPRAGDAFVFQLNPERLSRRVGVAANGRAQETISFTLAADATEYLEVPDSNPAVRDHGVYPMLAALEMFLHPVPRDPPSFWERLRGIGASNRAQPLAMFVWGEHRAVPVRVTRLDIAEEMHDPRLSPIHATVGVRLQVLTDRDLPNNDQIVDLWRRHIAGLDRLAGWTYQQLP